MTSDAGLTRSGAGDSDDATEHAASQATANQEITNQEIKGVTLAFFGMALVSTDSLFIRLADVSAYDIVFWVGIMMSTAILVLVRIQQGRVLTQIRAGGSLVIGAALLQTASTTFFVLAVNNTRVANVVAVIAAAPILAAAFSWVWFRERVERRTWIAIGLLVVGVAVVVSGSVGGGGLLGDFFALAAVSCFALNLTIFRRYQKLNAFLVVGLAGLGMAMFAFLPASFEGYTSNTWLALVGMGLIAGPVSRIALAQAARYMPSAKVALFAPVETVLASVWVYLAFDEAPLLETYIGGSIILVAVFIGVGRVVSPRGVRLPVRSH